MARERRKLEAGPQGPAFPFWGAGARPKRGPRLRTGGSDVETEVHDVAVLDGVFFPFDAEFSVVAGGGFRTKFDEVRVGDDLGLYEAFFEVGVDDAGGLWGFPAFVDGPGADFLYAGGEVGGEVEQAVYAADEFVEGGFG